MKLPDTNVLVYAANKAARQHAAALRWLQNAFDEPAGVALAWTALLGFVRITTHPRILDRPLSVDNALRTVGFWLDQPNASALGPGERHFELLRGLLRESGGTGNLAGDAHLAAIAIENGATLGSFDSDFERFEGLRFERLRA